MSNDKDFEVLNEHQWVSPEPPAAIGESPNDHGVAREMLCAFPRPLTCRLCTGTDCPFIAYRSPNRLHVEFADPPPPMAPEDRKVRTGAGNTSSIALWKNTIPLLMLLALAFMIVEWLLNPNRPEITWWFIAVGAGWLIIFSLVNIGVPLVRYFWKDHGGKRNA